MGLDLAGGEDDDPGSPAYWQKHLAEGHTPFEAEPAHAVTLETLRSIYATVLTNYRHACALTGQQFDLPVGLLHEKLEVTPIRPLHMGGALHVNNLLCLEAVAAQDFRSGHISIGPGWEILIDLSRIDPELLERLNPNGRVRLPDAEHAWPDPEAVRFHRTTIFMQAGRPPP